MASSDERFGPLLFFGDQWPVRDAGLTTMNYREVSCPEAKVILKSCVYLKGHEGMDEAYADADADADGAARAIRKVAQHYQL